MPDFSRARTDFSSETRFIQRDFLFACRLLRDIRAQYRVHTHTGQSQEGRQSRGQVLGLPRAPADGHRRQYQNTNRQCAEGKNADADCSERDDSRGHTADGDNPRGNSAAGDNTVRRASHGQQRHPRDLNGRDRRCRPCARYTAKSATTIEATSITPKRTRMPKIAFRIWRKPSWLLPSRRIHSGPGSEPGRVSTRRLLTKIPLLKDYASASSCWRRSAS